MINYVDFEGMDETDLLFMRIKNDIFDILAKDTAEIVNKFTYKIGEVEHEFKFEHEETLEVLGNVQAINLGLVDTVTVTDVNGNRIEMNKDEYVARNSVGFKNKAKGYADLRELKDVLDKVETFAELVDFENLATAKAKYIVEGE